MQKYLRRWHRKNLAGAWRQWRRVHQRTATARIAELEASQQKHAQGSLQKYLRRWREKRVAGAWREWTTLVKLELQAQKAMQKYLRRWHRKNLAGAWRQWRRVHQRTAAREVGLRRHLGRWRLRQAGAAWRRWQGQQHRTVGADAQRGATLRRLVAEFVARRVVGPRLAAAYVRAAWLRWREELKRLAGLEQRNRELEARMARMEAQLLQAVSAIAAASAEGERRGCERVRHFALASPGKKRAGKILERAWADWCRAVEALRREEAAAEALWEEQREKFASDPVGAALGNVEGAIGNVFGAIEIPPFTSLWDNDKRGPESRHNTPPPSPEPHQFSPSKNSPWGAWG